jgi:hypothetical protein
MNWMLKNKGKIQLLSVLLLILFVILLLMSVTGNIPILFAPISILGLAVLWVFAQSTKTKKIKPEYGRYSLPNTEYDRRKQISERQEWQNRSEEEFEERKRKQDDKFEEERKQREEDRQQERLERERCSKCRGREECAVCRGSGKVEWGTHASGMPRITMGAPGSSRYVRCRHCGGSGVCPEYR